MTYELQKFNRTYELKEIIYESKENDKQPLRRKPAKPWHEFTIKWRYIKWSENTKYLHKNSIDEKNDDLTERL